MPQDLNKATGGTRAFTHQVKQSTLSQSASAEENGAITALNQTAAGTIRQSIGAMTQLAEKLEDQREQVTDHAANRVAAILDPHSIQAEIAVKTLEKLEGKSFVPFELEAIELPELRPYVPQLPASYAAHSSPQLPPASETAAPSETTSNGRFAQAIPGKGFGVQAKN